MITTIVFHDLYNLSSCATISEFEGGDFKFMQKNIKLSESDGF